MKKQTAIDLFGSGAALARALGITKGAVSHWGEEVPQVHALRIRYELRPEHFQGSSECSQGQLSTS